MITEEMMNRVQAHVDACFRKFFEYPPKIKIVFRTDLNRFGGFAYRDLSRIELNTQMFLANTEEFFQRTIPHEVGHIVQFILKPKAKQAHGPEWREIMTIMGYGQSRTHSYDTSVSTGKETFKYKCGCSDKMYFLSRLLHKKVSSGEHRTCRKCKTRIVYFSNHGIL